MTHARRVRHDFSRAANTYDQHADLQREVLDESWLMLQPYLLDENVRILDAGCATGHLARSKKGNFIQLDSAEGMCRKASPFAPTLCADLESIPLRPGSMDAIFSSLVFQWVDNLQTVFQECFRVTKPGGVIAISTFGPDTLQELRQAYDAIDMEPSVYSFDAQMRLEVVAENQGWITKQKHQSDKQKQYDDFYDLLHELRGLGATFKQETSGLTLDRLHGLKNHYDSYYSINGKIFATFDIYTYLFWKPL